MSAADVASQGALYGFGNNNGDQLGTIGAGGPRHQRIQLPRGRGHVVSAAAGSLFSLVATSTGQLYGFGENNAGQVGVSNTTTVVTPLEVRLPGARGRVVQVAAGENDGLALTSSGQLFSFGDNRAGELGRTTNSGTSNPNPAPGRVRLAGATGRIVQIAAGAYFNLALTSSGQVYAWGDNSAMQLGNRDGFHGGHVSLGPHPTPSRVHLPRHWGRIVKVTAGSDFSYALSSRGALYAWGRNTDAEFGFYPGPEFSARPLLVARPQKHDRVIDIAAGSFHSLVLTSTGRVTFWGDGGRPYRVKLATHAGRVTLVAASYDSSLLLTSANKLFAFGQNTYGQLGIRRAFGTSDKITTPMRVRLPGGKLLTISQGTQAVHTLVSLSRAIT